jgi:hypothetical protein
MAIITTKYLKELSKKHPKESWDSKIGDSGTNQEFDIFISHSYFDKDTIEGLYYLLSSSGYIVYIDWIIDGHLNRENVTKDTAELIRKRMKSSKSLLFTVSTNASFSKWMPWELGFVDGITSKCATLPITPNEEIRDEFERSEYLLLYPYLYQKNIGDIFYLYIVETPNKYVLFDDWLNNGVSPTYNDIKLF